MRNDTFPTVLIILDPATDAVLPVSAAYGPRAVARALMATFNDDPEWNPRHIGRCASAISDFTAGVGTIHDVRAILKAADLTAEEA